MYTTNHQRYVYSSFCPNPTPHPIPYNPLDTLTPHACQEFLRSDRTSQSPPTQGVVIPTQSKSHSPERTTEQWRSGLYYRPIQKLKSKMTPVMTRHARSIKISKVKFAPINTRKLIPQAPTSSTNNNLYYSSDDIRRF